MASQLDCGNLCETVGIVALEDILVEPKKQKLNERLAKNPIIKKKQMEFYAKKKIKKDATTPDGYNWGEITQ